MNKKIKAAGLAFFSTGLAVSLAFVFVVALSVLKFFFPQWGEIVALGLMLLLLFVLDFRKYVKEG